MARKRLAAEQIVTKLRQIEVMQGQGKSIAAACKEAAAGRRRGGEGTIAECSMFPVRSY